MFLKDHLKDTYQKASFVKNYSILENLVNRWVHRFGIESLNELIEENKDQIKSIGEYQEEENKDQIKSIEEYQEEENKDQIKSIEEYQEEENKDQINLEFLENVPNQVEINFKSNKVKVSNNNGIVRDDIYELNKNISEYVDKENLPLPNINNLRKWIKNEKKAS